MGCLAHFQARSQYRETELEAGQVSTKGRLRAFGVLEPERVLAILRQPTRCDREDSLIADLGHHADDETLFLDVVRLNRVLILQNLASTRISKSASAVGSLLMTASTDRSR